MLSERTVGAALRGRPAWNSVSATQWIDGPLGVELDLGNTPGGHGGPPLQYVRITKAF